jgi:hypothetical protein
MCANYWSILRLDIDELCGALDGGLDGEDLLREALDGGLDGEDLLR